MNRGCSLGSFELGQSQTLPLGVWSQVGVGLVLVLDTLPLLGRIGRGQCWMYRVGLGPGIGLIAQRLGGLSRVRATSL